MLRAAHVVLLAAPLVFLAAACGGGGADQGTTASSSTAGSTSATGEGGAGGQGGATGTASATGGGGSEVPTAPHYLIGRFDESDPARPKASWSGTTFRTRISGTSLSVTLGGAKDVRFEIEIDGEAAGTFTTAGGDQTYEVASGLSEGEHSVVLVRRNEGFFGNVSFLGFTPGAGATIVPTPFPYRHRVEIIGDSLSAGYGIEGASATCDFSGATESYYGSYGAVAGRALGLAVHDIAYSGKGVFQNYGGKKTELMPELWRRTLTNDAASAWDFSRFVPEAVIVNLGTNDFSASIAEADFEGAYRALLGEVRAVYPAAMIFCVTWAHWGATHEGWVTSAMAATGDPALRHLRFKIDPADGLGCDYHTNLVTNAKLGAQLAEALTAELGF